MQFDFLALVVVYWFKLVVILLQVVQGSKKFLPTLPTWLEPPPSQETFKINIIIQHLYKLGKF